MIFRSLILTLALLAALHSQAAIIDLDALIAAEPQAEVAEAAEPQVSLVEVRDSEKGQFLALVPINVPVRVRAFPNGEVEVITPWYANFAVMNKGELITRLKAAVSNAWHRKTLSTIKAEGEASTPTFTPEEATAVEKAIKDELAKSGD